MQVFLPRTYRTRAPKQLLSGATRSSINPDQRLTLEETLIGYTRNAAYAEFQEHQKGQLKEGYLADIVLLSEDIFQTPPEEIANVKPLFTMVDGEMVYEA